MEERSNTTQLDLNLNHTLIRLIGGGLSPNNTKHHTDHILFSTRALQNEKLSNSIKLLKRNVCVLVLNYPPSVLKAL